MQTELLPQNYSSISEKKLEQAGTGPSRRHIEGSKIAKGLHSVFSSTAPQKIFGKKVSMSKKLKGGPFGIFQHPFCRKTQKIGDPLVEKNSEKSVTMPKQLKGGHFSLARYCMIRGKKEKPFWFSSLGQQVQFKIL